MLTLLNQYCIIWGRCEWICYKYVYTSQRKSCNLTWWSRPGVCVCVCVLKVQASPHADVFFFLIPDYTEIFSPPNENNIGDEISDPVHQWHVLESCGLISPRLCDGTLRGMMWCDSTEHTTLVLKICLLAKKKNPVNNKSARCTWAREKLKWALSDCICRIIYYDVAHVSQPIKESFIFSYFNDFHVSQMRKFRWKNRVNM